MKRLVYILFAAAALIPGLAGCGGGEQTNQIHSVDLRYRAKDNYEVAAINAQPINIDVVCSDPWTITSAHPDWCIISDEEGKGFDPEQVRIGKGEATKVRIQYYDNVVLDDRIDQITIQSGSWVGKVITVTQKGTAFLTIPDEELEMDVEKGGGDIEIHVSSNQNWSAKVTSRDTDWLTIADGATGLENGTVTVHADLNGKEIRTGRITLYDRRDVAMVHVVLTQDGLKLVPAKTEVRAQYNETSVEIGVSANAGWSVKKDSDSADWITIDTPTGNQDGTIKLTLTENEYAYVRKAEIILENVIATDDEYQAKKTITIKQGFHVIPEHYVPDNDELSLWSLEEPLPVYTAGVGTKFEYPSRMSRSGMKMGTYTFCWSNFTTDATAAEPARARLWFCFKDDPNDDGAEMKVDIRPYDDGGKVSVDFNAAGDGNKPSVSSMYGMDFSKPVEVTVKFEPSDLVVEDEESGDTKTFCKVSFSIDGVAGSSFETGPELFRTCYWGASMLMYVGMYKCGSAVLEWYEYSAPIDWD